MNELWFPAIESQSVVGRFIEVEVVHPAKSREEGREVRIIRPALESKVAGSHDTSVQAVKPFNEKALQARFPGAWEHFEKTRGPAEKEQIVAPAVGTPLDRLDFIPREKLLWLKMQGFSTVEQIALMSDATMQNLGPGVRQWRKKATQLLQKG